MADDSMWTFALQGVSRIEPDLADDDVGEWPTWAVTFDCAGPDLSAEVEVFIDDIPDEADVITRAMSVLHLAFAAWARATAGRLIANDDGVAG